MLFVCECVTFPFFFPHPHINHLTFPPTSMASSCVVTTIHLWLVNGVLPVATQTARLNCKEGVWSGVEGGARYLTTSCSVLLPPLLNKLCCWGPSHGVHLPPKGLTLYFTVGAGWLNSYFFSILQASLCLYCSVLCSADDLWGSKIHC